MAEGSRNALSLQWTFGFSKEIRGGVHSLSSDERNLAYMREEGMEQLVEKFGKVKDDRVQMFVKQLRERL